MSCSPEGPPEMIRRPFWCGFDRVSVLLVVGLDDLRRDTPAVGNLETVLAGPGTDGLVLLTVNRSRARHRGLGRRATCRTLTATCAASVLDILSKRITQLFGIFAGEIDL